MPDARKRCVVAVLAVALSGASARPPLTLDDAVRRSAQLPTSRAADAVRDALAASAAARNGPRASLATSFVSQPQSGTSPQYQAALEYTLDFGSNLRRFGALAAARAQAAGSDATLAQTRRATTRGVVAAFFALASAQAELATQTQTADLQARTLAVVTARRAEGVAPDLDVARTNAASAVAHADLAAARVQRDGARDILAEFVDAAAPFDAVALPDVPSTLPDADVVADAAVRTSPDVASAVAVMRAAEAAATIARAESAPGLSIGAGPGISRTGTAQSVGPAATISYTIPFANALVRSDVAGADASALVARAGIERARRDAIAAALAARTATASALARLPLLRVAMDATRRVADADLAGYELGAVPVSDVLLAQTQASTARGAYDTARVVAAEAAATLHLEMGDL